MSRQKKIVNEIINEPFGAVAEALGRWPELVEGSATHRAGRLHLGSDED